MSRLLPSVWADAPSEGTTATSSATAATSEGTTATSSTTAEST